MTKLEALLRISVVQAELMQLADALDPHTAATLRYTSRILRLIRVDTLAVVDPEIESPISKIG